MAQYGFAFDGVYCNGCKTCVLACKDRYDLDVDLAFRKVYEYGGGGVRVGADGMFEQDCFGYHVSVACNHCAEPACTAACPTGAMQKDEATGLVTTDPEVCIACGACQMACPYGAPVVREDIGHSVKCTGCKDRVDVGLVPICVEACPQRALKFGLIDELRAAYGDAADIAPLAAPDLTHPSLCVIPFGQMRQSDDAEGMVLNPAEVM